MSNVKIFLKIYCAIALGWAVPLMAGTSSDISQPVVYDLSPTYLAIGISATHVGITNAIQIAVDNSGDGGTSMKLGGIGLLNDGQMAGIEWSVVGPGILSYDWKVSSETNYDWLWFYETGTSKTNRISGMTDWARQPVTVLGAADLSHTFRWEYEKDPVGDYVGQDCGWVDAISWNPLFTLNIQNGTGNGLYTNNTSVAIMADAPSIYHEFDRWTGDTNAVANIFSAGTSLLMPNSNVIITATYKDILYPVVVNNGNGDGSYTNNATITIYADAPPAHFEFDRWIGATNTVVNILSTNTTAIIPGAGLTVTATYKPIYYSVVVNNGTGDGSYTNQTAITINADATMTHFTFDKWSGNTNGVLNIFAPSTTLKVPGASVTVTATYKDILCPVTITGGQGGGSYSYGSTVELMATIPTDKRFYRWSGSTNYVADVNAQTTTLFIAEETISITALYSVPLTVNSGTGSGWYPEGSRATVSANADPMWKEFSAWTGDAGLLANAGVRTTTLTLPTAPASVTATYKDSIARLTGSYGRTYSESGTSGAITPDAGADSPSGTPAVKLGGAGVISDNGFAAFETIVSGSGSILFQWKVSSEPNGDYLKFKVDGLQVAAITGTKVPWTQVSNRFETAGSHTLRWEYVKNGSVASSTDAGWVDDIIWIGDTPKPLLPPVIVHAALTNQSMSIQFTGERGISYLIQTNGTLDHAGWSDYQTLQPIWINESNGVHRFKIGPSALGPDTLFYRVLTPVMNEPPTPPFVMVAIPSGTNSGTDPDIGTYYSLTNEASFYMDATEVTKAKWDEVYTWAVTNGYTFANAGLGKGSNHPIHTVNWYDCVKWCNARSEKEGKMACYTVSGSIFKTGQSIPDCNFSVNGYRLPTLTEWNYAARGGLSGNRFPWGDTINHDRANYYANGSAYSYDTSPYMTNTYHPAFCDATMPYTSPVGNFVANGYGLYDMAGNVYEWCNEISSVTEILLSPIRGGSWKSNANSVRFFGTTRTRSDLAGYFYGFRTVCR